MIEYLSPIPVEPYFSKGILLIKQWEGQDSDQSLYTRETPHIASFSSSVVLGKTGRVKTSLKCIIFATNLVICAEVVRDFAGNEWSCNKI